MAQAYFTRKDPEFLEEMSRLADSFIEGPVNHVKTYIRTGKASTFDELSKKLRSDRKILIIDEETEGPARRVLYFLRKADRPGEYRMLEYRR